MNSENTTKPVSRFTRAQMLLGFVTVCLLLWVVIQRARQPQYQGKTAEEWFSEVTSTSSGTELVDRDPAVIGLRHLGTNAVWFLWREKDRQDAPWLTSFHKQMDRLTGRYRNRPGRISAWVVLFQFGPETEVLIPEALKLLKNGHPDEAAYAALLLGRTQRQPEVVVPAILQSLTVPSQNIDTRIRHIVGLRELGPQAKAAVPALRAHLSNSAVASTYEGDWVAKAILIINGPGPELGRFTNALTSGNFTNSYPAIIALSQVGTNARPAAPVLFQFAQTLTNASELLQVSNVIHTIDPEGIYKKPPP